MRRYFIRLLTEFILILSTVPWNRSISDPSKVELNFRHTFLLTPISISAVGVTFTSLLSRYFLLYQWDGNRRHRDVVYLAIKI